MSRKRTLFEFSFTSNNPSTGREIQNESTAQNMPTLPSEQSEPEADDSDETETRTSGTCTGSTAKKRKISVFQRKWTEQWPWLRKDDKGMKCSVCEKHRKSNPFTSPEGCNNYRTSTLKRHANSSEHTDGLRSEALQKDFSQV